MLMSLKRFCGAFSLALVCTVAIAQSTYCDDYGNCSGGGVNTFTDAYGNTTGTINGESVNIYKDSYGNTSWFAPGPSETVLSESRSFS